MALAAMLFTVSAHAAAPPWQAADEVTLASLPHVRVVPPPVDAFAGEPRLPARFAVPVGLRLHSGRDGRWDALPSGQAVWRAVVEAPGARSLSARVHLSDRPGARLWIHGAAGTVIFGPYDSRSNGAADLWTPVVPGAQLVLEWEQPDATSAIGGLDVEEVYYGLDDAAAQPKSGACETDVVCPIAAPWRDEVRSTVRLVILGQFLCTATLLNNTARDGSGILLTANHCEPDAAHGVATVVYWNYQSTSCNGTPDGLLDQAQVGAERLAGEAATDVALVRLLAPPPALYRVYYAGWDRSAAVPPDGGVTLHHPAGQEKRISITHQALRPTSRFSSETPGDGNYLEVGAWDVGATEPGSSGAALWNFGHRVVGQLSGGTSSCGQRQPDWFGRLASGWTVLSPHLDPLGTGGQTLDGMNADGSPGQFQPPPPAPAPSAGGSGGGAFATGSLLALLLGALRRRRHLRR